MMSFNWKKSLIALCDIAIAVYLVMAVTAFNKPDTTATRCTEVKTEIEAGPVEGFLNPDGITALLKREKMYPLSLPMDDIKPRLIEEALQKSPLIDKAECYKTLGGAVCIRVRQRIPVVKVMTDGDSYYVDSQGAVMPESRYAADLVVATGNISRKYAQKHLASMANTLLADKFWNSQVVQLNVLADGTVEMVPRVGDHILYIGQPVNVGRKLDRLRKFYLYGLNQAGWNKYAYISVEFDNQIICKRK